MRCDACPTMCPRTSLSAPMARRRVSLAMCRAHPEGCAHPSKVTLQSSIITGADAAAAAAAAAATSPQAHAHADADPATPADANYRLLASRATHASNCQSQPPTNYHTGKLQVCLWCPHPEALHTMSLVYLELFLDRSDAAHHQAHHRHCPHYHDHHRCKGHKCPLLKHCAPHGSWPPSLLACLFWYLFRFSTGLHRPSPAWHRRERRLRSRARLYLWRVLSPLLQDQLRQLHFLTGITGQQYHGTQQRSPQCGNASIVSQPTGSEHANV